MKKPAVFLDRDGTINVEKNYLHKTEDWEWITGAIEAIKKINQNNFLAIVVTNQSGVARGYYGESDILTLHEHVNEILKQHGAWIDAFYYCPHHPDINDGAQCTCRKPLPGMLLQADNDFEIDMANSFLIGDKASDIESGNQLGLKTILVETGYGLQDRPNVKDVFSIEKDLSSAVDIIINKTIKTQ